MQRPVAKLASTHKPRMCHVKQPEGCGFESSHVTLLVTYHAFSLPYHLFNFLPALIFETKKKKRQEKHCVMHLQKEF